MTIQNNNRIIIKKTKRIVENIHDNENKDDIIPKIIHYCWISGDKYPENIQECIDSWHEHFSDFTFMKWGLEEIMSIKELPNWVHVAIKNKKYAFAADYIRQYCVYNYGGWYFDSDVFFIDKIPNYLYKYEFVSTIENTISYYSTKGRSVVRVDGFTYGIGIEAGMFGGIKGCELCGKILDFYKSEEYNEIFDIEKINAINKNPFKDRWYPLAPQIMAKYAELFGFKYPITYNGGHFINNRKYYLSSDLTLHSMPTVSKSRLKDFCSIHRCYGSWRIKENETKAYSNYIC